MKVKKLLAIAISLLIILSSILITYPLIVEENYRSSLNQSPFIPGSYFIYDFSSFTNQTKGNSTVLYPQYGVLKFNVISEYKISVKAKINIACGGGYYWNNTYDINSSFISYFLNNASLTQPLVNISGVVSKVSGSSSRYPNTISNQNNVSGCTNPIKLNPINVNETLASKNNNYLYFSKICPNEFEYDQSGGYNVLIMSQINGNISLISKLFDRSMPYAIDFKINLKKTDIALNPLDYKLYLLKDLQYLFILWFVGIPLILLVIRNAKKRALKKLRENR